VAQASPNPSALRDPTISVIVPTYNRAHRLGRLLAELDSPRQRGPRFEVVVGIDGENDDTRARLAALRTTYPLSVVTSARRGASAARNAAIAVATGDVLVFLDYEVLPDGGLLERHLVVHRSDPLAAVIGRMAAPPDRTLPVWLDWEATLLDRRYARLVQGHIALSWRDFFTANASVRREHAIAVGGFDERFLRVQDVEFASRLAAQGLHFHFVSDAVIHHDPDKTLETWLRLAFERGRYHLMLESKRGPDGQLYMHDDWRRRHPLSRMLARWCVGHAVRTRFVVGALRRAITAPLVTSRRLRLLLCSAVFNIKYWDGVAEATGLGAALWPRFIDAPANGIPPRHGASTPSI
jgi:GT2 family glycosyltransferase